MDSVETPFPPECSLSNVGNIGQDTIHIIGVARLHRERDHCCCLTTYISIPCMFQTKHAQILGGAVGGARHHFITMERRKCKLSLGLSLPIYNSLKKQQKMFTKVNLWVDL